MSIYNALELSTLDNFSLRQALLQTATIVLVPTIPMYTLIFNSQSITRLFSFLAEQCSIKSE